MNSTNKNRAYKCIFFDLDHTLWDYEANARETLGELYHAYDLATRGILNAEYLYTQFRKVNLALWDQYDRELISHDVIRKQRFRMILEHFSVFDEKLASNLSQDYLYACPRKGNLMPYAADVLQYLSSSYRLTIVTNGFEEIQHTKLTSGRLHNYFDHIVTSQKAGHRKPSQKIFEYAMAANAVTPSQVIMIGDNLVTDIGGARLASIDSVFFNPEKIRHESEIHHEISCLSELKNIL
jgi:YjjG family noncanonical pyrimidine nucleotidase